MVRMFCITRKSDGYIKYRFRFQKTAQKCYDTIPESEKDKWEITYKDSSVNSFPEWSWFWYMKSPEQEWKEHLESIPGGFYIEKL